MVRAAILALAIPFGAQPPAPPLPLLISPSELAAALGDRSLVLLHVADRAESFAQGHIPGARFVGYADLAVDGDGLGSELPAAGEIVRVFAAAGVTDASRVVIYGTSTVAAARAFFTLDVLGHRQVALLDGGLRAWRAERRAVATGAAPPPARPGELTARLTRTRVVDAAFVRARLGAAARMALLDVRPDPEYLGTDDGGGHHAAGHIPGARQLPWDTLVAADGRFLPRAELRERLRRAGAAADVPVVAYCMVGMRASVVYFVARYLGYDARLYDGSIVDWSRRQLPVETGRR